MKVDHIGYLSADINKSIQLFQQLGFKQESAIFVDNILNEENISRNVYICFMRNEDTRVELVCPIDEKSDVYFTLKRQGEGPYHICYQVDNIDDKIGEMKKFGWMMLKRPTKAIAFNNARVVFLFKNGAGTIELVELKE